MKMYFCKVMVFIILFSSCAYAMDSSFTPSGSTLTLSATSTSSSVTFTGGAINSTQLLVSSAGPNTCFIRFGVGAQTAVATDTPILSGTVQMFNKGIADTVAAICGSGNTATIYVTAGQGS